VISICLELKVGTEYWPENALVKWYLTEYRQSDALNADTIVTLLERALTSGKGTVLRVCIATCSACKVKLSIIMMSDC
jgi:hypothetical protein